MYAVKVLRTSKATEGRSAEWFRREGELGAKLKHDNIVPIHEVVSRGALHYIVMDFIEGQNLRELARVRNKLKWEEACLIVEGMLAGLQYAFSLGVTHRDLKMSNVLISSEGHSKLIDFGLAALDNVASDEGVDRTVEYAALEKATGVRRTTPEAHLLRRLHLSPTSDRRLDPAEWQGPGCSASDATRSSRSNPCSS